MIPKRNPKCALNVYCIQKRCGFVKPNLGLSGFFRHSRENGNPDVVPRIKYGAGSAKTGNHSFLRTGFLFSQETLDTRFRGYDRWGYSNFYWYGSIVSKRVAVVLEPHWENVLARGGDRRNTGGQRQA